MGCLNLLPQVPRSKVPCQTSSTSELSRHQAAYRSGRSSAATPFDVAFDHFFCKVYKLIMTLQYLFILLFIWGCNLIKSLYSLYMINTLMGRNQGVHDVSRSRESCVSKGGIDLARLTGAHWHSSTLESGRFWCHRHPSLQVGAKVASKLIKSSNSPSNQSQLAVMVDENAGTFMSTSVGVSQKRIEHHQIVYIHVYTELRFTC